MSEFDKSEYIEQGGLYVDDGCIWYEGAKYLPERTCEMINIKSGDRADYDCDEHIFHCKNCHAERGVYASADMGRSRPFREIEAHTPRIGDAVAVGVRALHEIRERGVMTNYEKYFGTPERAAEMEVERYVDALTRINMVSVIRLCKPVAVVKARYFGVWLKMEAEDGR